MMLQIISPTSTKDKSQLHQSKNGIQR